MQPSPSSTPISPTCKPGTQTLPPPPEVPPLTLPDSLSCPGSPAMKSLPPPPPATIRHSKHCPTSHHNMSHHRHHTHYVLVGQLRLSNLSLFWAKYCQWPWFQLCPWVQPEALISIGRVLALGRSMTRQTLVNLIWPSSDVPWLWYIALLLGHQICKLVLMRFCEQTMMAWLTIVCGAKINSSVSHLFRGKDKLYLKKCLILSVYETPTRSCGRLNTVIIELFATLEAN